MKKILIILFCCTTDAAFAQEQQFFLKKFPVNNSTRYITNSPTVRGIVFFYRNAADTNKAVFYIENFKQSDIKFFAEKVKFSNSKICFNNYKSSPGEFIYSFHSDGKLIYFYQQPPETKLN